MRVLQSLHGQFSGFHFLIFLKAFKLRNSLEVTGSISRIIGPG